MCWLSKVIGELSKSNNVKQGRQSKVNHETANEGNWTNILSYKLQDLDNTLWEIIPRSAEHNKALRDYWLVICQIQMAQLPAIRCQRFAGFLLVAGVTLSPWTGRGNGDFCAGAAAQQLIRSDILGDDGT